MAEAECHVGVSKIDEPVVGDCDAVRVSGQIMQNVFGTTKGALRIHHPVFAEQRPQKPPEGGLFRQRKACAIESELLIRGVLQLLVPHQELQRRQIGPTFDEVGRKSMAKRMRAEAFR